MPPSQVDIAGTAGKAVIKVVHRCTDATENQNLDLSDCQLMSFPDAIFHLMRNTVVLACDLSSNVLRKIPPKLPLKFTHITELNLAHNRLSTLPEELKDIPELRKLDISYNDYMSMPWVIFRLPKLTYLDARKNYISDVETPRLRNVSTLREVHLEENPLSEDACRALENLSSTQMVVHVSPPNSSDSDDESSDDDK
uniref:Putative leucine-rich repeat lrr protein associated with apoptosis in muscle tissue n=2 Tax=Ixodes ricinus TaxID=34613 RepID=A0A131Y5E8_IXORI